MYRKGVVGEIHMIRCQKFDPDEHGVGVEGVGLNERRVKKILEKERRLWKSTARPDLKGRDELSRPGMI